MSSDASEIQSAIPLASVERVEQRLSWRQGLFSCFRAAVTHLRRRCSPLSCHFQVPGATSALSRRGFCRPIQPTTEIGVITIYLLRNYGSQLIPLSP